MNRWSRNHDQCVHCGRADRQHEGKGFCVVCYGHHRDRSKALARKKQRRLRMSDEAIAKQLEFTRAWRERNRERVRAYAAAWRERNRSGVQA
ncbi:MAG TPA: hypothetical protein VK171_05295 [Fimbriimonas sp.]|nr:hypothetical protein [Fimbriimonas sp.]